MRLSPLALVALLAAPLAQAETADFNFGSHSFRAAVAGPLTRAASGLTGSYELGVVYKKGDNNSSDPRKTQLTLGHASVLATGDAGSSHAKTQAGVGARLVYADRDNSTGGAFALGGQFNTRVPGFERAGLSGYAWLAPSITTFGEIAQYHEYALDADFEVVKAASVYGGYRKVNAKSDRGGSGDADSDLHLGVRFNF